ncbi:MAG: YaiI/YqxD family protein [Gammaproteobacteria bacterium]|nr:YaiI/YqxD family protein [Gammaproteobacteria bacterium]
MQIWVDADACPRVIKDILYRAARRVEVPLILVANQPLQVPLSPLISTRQVAGGFDVADDYIAAQVAAGDIVVTADIPLAAEVVEKGAHALNPRGELYTRNNIRQRLAMRDFMEEMRSTGQVSGGPPPLNQQDRQAFANQLDRLMAKRAVAGK